MKYRISMTINARDENDALVRLYGMLSCADQDADDVNAELIEPPTREEIKFLVENSTDSIEDLTDLATDMKYPHIDELIEFLQGRGINNG